MSSDYARVDWCIELLRTLGNADPFAAILAFLCAWTKVETSGPPGAMYNLLNTELKAPGSTNFNSAGVQNFVSFEQGVAANAWVLNNGLYPNLLHMFSTNDPSVLSNTLALTTDLNIWCGGCNYLPTIRSLLQAGNIGTNDMFPGDEAMSNIEIMPFTEFSPNFTEFACGPMGVATCAFAAQPGKPAAANTDAAKAWAYAEYAKVNGDAGPGNTNGSSIPNMRTFLVDTQNGSTPNKLHFWEMNTVNVASIKAAIAAQYPVIVTITEASVFDVDTQVNPYWWGASGSHIFTIVGVDKDGMFLVDDTAAVEQGDGNLQTPKTPLPWPRRYDPNKLVLTGYGTPVQMPWLPAIPSGDPLSWPTPTPPPPPVDFTLQAALTVWSAILGSVNHNTGIFNMWYADYKRGLLRGPALTGELSYVDAQGQKGVVQLFPGGQYQWINGIGSFSQYT